MANMESIMRNGEPTKTRMMQALRVELTAVEPRAKEEHAAHNSTKMAAMERQVELEHPAMEASTGLARIQRMADDKTMKAAELEQKVALQEVECASLIQELQDLKPVLVVDKTSFLNRQIKLFRERGNAIFSIIGYINGSNRAQSGRQDWRDLSASCPEEERTREQRNKEEISSHVFSSDTLQQHFGSKCEDVPKSLGSKFGLAISFPFSVCASTLKCICRYRGIPWRPNRITKSGVSIGNMTIEGGVSIVGNSNISAPVLIGNTFVYQLLVTQIPEGERQLGIQLSELVGSYVNMNTGGGVSIGNTNIEVGCI